MRKKLKKKGIIFAGAITGMHLINKYLFSKTPLLINTLNGEENYFFSQYGKVYYVKKGTGEPLLLLHNLASGVTSFVWRKNFEVLSEYYTVYAIDMPGFGKSQKLAITYKATIYQEVIKSFIKEIIGEPVSIIAAGQSASYAIQLDYKNPDIIKSIIAICPTGIFEKALPPRTSEKLTYCLLRAPVLGTFLYNSLVSSPGRKYYIKNKSYYNSHLATQGLLDYYKISSRQGGYLSKFAPASFLGGYLNQDVTEALCYASTPLFIIWGRNAKMNKVENLRSFLDLNHDADYYVFDNCGLLPQEEHPEKFNDICIKFLNNGKFKQ